VRLEQGAVRVDQPRVLRLPKKREGRLALKILTSWRRGEARKPKLGTSIVFLNIVNASF
jgi:hypothetical protein